VIVLCVTVVINLIFIWDTTKRYNREAVNANKVQGEINELQRQQNQGKLTLLQLKFEPNV